MALAPLAQTLLTVVHTVDSGRPAPMAHWRAGFCPRLLQRQYPGKRQIMGSNEIDSRLTLQKARCQRELLRPQCDSSLNVRQQLHSIEQGQQLKPAGNRQFSSIQAFPVLPLIACDPSCVAEREDSPLQEAVRVSSIFRNLE
jgi:hypothetical protein